MSIKILIYFLVPLASAAIGWVTNYLAIKMLFHPRKPINILGLKIQGIFPKRQKALSQQLGELVSEKLLSFDDIKSKLASADNLDGLKPLIEEKIETMLRGKFSEMFPLASFLIGEKTIEKLKNNFSDEILKQLPDLIEGYVDNVEGQLDVKKLVAEKVENFDVLELEGIMKNVLSSEFRFIEILGAVIGFFIGLLQLMLMLLMPDIS